MTAVPQHIIVSQLPPNVDVLTTWLTAKRGAKVRISVPARGAKRDLLGTVRQNAQESPAIHKLRRAGDLTARSQALQQLQEDLDLAEAPLRIECIDISGHQGTDQSASIVVFEDGIAKKSEYRKYAIPDNLDDLSAMREAVTRRFSALCPARDENWNGGGIGQDSSSSMGRTAGQRCCCGTGDLGIDFIAVCGLAKRLEEVWLPGV